jgi:CPA1 family monovalent cation:H+ antiporter
MVIGGLVLGFLPGILKITLDPDLVFLVILPPLLYAAAWAISWRDFRFNLVSILFLAFGLVAFTDGGVALLAPIVFPGFDWQLGFVLGAIVAPTDAIAATAIARRLGLPSRIVDILEGESLINDASGLLALEFATTILVSHQVPTIGSGIASFTWLTVGGIGIGLLIGAIVYFIERRVDDGPIEIALSILVPYVAYLAADKVHASGVLAVVACGLFLARRSVDFFSPSVRIQAWSFWDTLTFVLNGLVFVLTGLQLPSIRYSISEENFATLFWNGAIFSVMLTVLRLVWVFPGAWASWTIRTRLLKQD